MVGIYIYIGLFCKALEYVQERAKWLKLVYVAYRSK